MSVHNFKIDSDLPLTKSRAKLRNWNLIAFIFVFQDGSVAGDGKPGTIVPDGEYQWDKDRRYVEYPHSTHSSFHVILLTLSTQLFKSATINYRLFTRTIYANFGSGGKYLCD